MTVQNKFSLYIHIPFCQSKCRYCDYFTVRDKNGYLDSYINSIILEIKSYKGKILKTIYLGGGTPSLLSFFQLKILVDAIKDNFIILWDDIEFTIEVNPDSLTIEKLKFYKEIGINRITIGVQSFNDKILSFLGRNYSVETVRNTIENSLKYFININIDLLFAVPEMQNIKDIENDFKIAVSYNIPHIAYYNLVIENATYFQWLKKNKRITEIEEELYEEEYLLINKFLTSEKFEHYELSTFTKKGFKCAHNLTYWRNGEYIGIGAGAHSYIGGKRFWNIKFPSEYIYAISSGREAIEGSESLDKDARLGETIMLLLHLEEGIDIRKINSDFGIDFISKFDVVLRELSDDRLIAVSKDNVKLTLRGKLFANAAARKFL